MVEVGDGPDVWAAELLGQCREWGWDLAPRVVVVPEPGRTVDAEGLFLSCQRDGVLCVGGRDCPVWLVPERFAKPWEVLVGSEAPDGVAAVALIAEAWVAVPRAGMDRSVYASVADRPDREEIRYVELMDRAGTVGAAAQSRTGNIEMERVWSSQQREMVGPYTAYMRRWMGAAQEEAPTTAWRAWAAHLVLRALDDGTRPGVHPMGRLVATVDQLVTRNLGGEFADVGYQPDGELTWEMVHQVLARQPGPEGNLYAWLGVDGTRHVFSHRRGELAWACTRVARSFGVDVARMVRWAITVDTEAVTSDRDKFVAPTIGDPALVTGQVTDPSWHPPSLLGVPLTHRQLTRGTTSSDEGEWVSRWVTYTPEDREVTRNRLELAARIIESNGRDLYTQPRTPGDLAAVQYRVFHDIDTRAVLNHQPGIVPTGVHPDTRWAIDTTLRSITLRRMLAVTVTNAVPYWIDSNTAIAVTGAHLPDDNFGDRLRLPHPSILIVFEDDLTLDDYTQARIDPLAGTPRDMLREFPAFEHGWAGGWGTGLGDLAAHGGGITGICLLATPDGQLSDHVLWVITARTDPREDRAWRTHIVPGTLSDATVRSAVLNLAAYVCWGDLIPPDPLPVPDPDDQRAWRKVTRTSQWRKKEPRGAAWGVHVVHVRPPQPATSTNQPTGTNRTVTGHLRRGHWRRSRIVITDPATGRPVGPATGPDAIYGVTYTYREHFIPPTAVAGGPSRTRLDVYRLPLPAHLDPEATPPSAVNVDDT